MHNLGYCIVMRGKGVKLNNFADLAVKKYLSNTKATDQNVDYRE